MLKTISCLVSIFLLFMPTVNAKQVDYPFELSKLEKPQADPLELDFHAYDCSAEFDPEFVWWASLANDDDYTGERYYLGGPGCFHRHRRANNFNIPTCKVSDIIEAVRAACKKNRIKKIRIFSHGNVDRISLNSNNRVTLSTIDLWKTPDNLKLFKKCFEKEAYLFLAGCLISSTKSGDPRDLAKEMGKLFFRNGGKVRSSTKERVEVPTIGHMKAYSDPFNLGRGTALNVLVYVLSPVLQAYNLIQEKVTKITPAAP